MTPVAGGRDTDSASNAVFPIFPGLARIRAANPSVMTRSGTNTYLIGTEDLAVIDPGPDDPDHLRRILDAAGGRIRYVLVTHHHRDHSAGARHLADEARAPLLAFGFPGTFEPDSELREGDTVAVDGFEITALHTPGHASDHLCFLADPTSAASSARWCISGDHVIGGSSVAVGPLDGSMTRYIESLERLIGLDPPITKIAPGHGEVIEDPPQVMNKYLANRRTREQLTLAALTETPQNPEELVPAVYRGLDDRLLRAATSTLWAHLRKLGEDGLATSDEPDVREGGWRLTPGAVEPEG